MQISEAPVFMGSGPDLAGRPGMTIFGGNNFLYTLSARRRWDTGRANSPCKGAFGLRRSAALEGAGFALFGKGAGGFVEVLGQVEL
jgi:hypothetical protein